jgi:hypothetical protein
MRILIPVLACVLLLAGCYSLPVTGNPGQAIGAAGKLAAAVNSTNFMIPLSILGVALGVTSMFMGNVKIGLPAVLGSITALVMTLAINRYASLMAAGGALAAAAALAIGIVLKYRSVAGQAVSVGTALKEVVTGVQKVKDTIWSGMNFSRATINETLVKEQSPKTQELVQEIKGAAA